MPNNRRITGPNSTPSCGAWPTACAGSAWSRATGSAILSRNSVEYQALYFAAGRAGLVLQPLNWRLAGAGPARSSRDAAPQGDHQSRDEFGEVTEQLQRDVDVPNWLQFGDEGDGSFERLVARPRATRNRSGRLRSATTTRSSSSTPAGTTGRVQGRHAHPPQRGGEMLDQTVAERIVPSDVYMLTGQMYHIPIVLAMNYMRHGCPLVLVNFEAKQALEIIEAEKVSAFLGITTMINWMMAVEDFASYDLSSLRNFQYGGGPMPSSIVRSAPGHLPVHHDPGLRADRGHRRCRSCPRRTTSTPSRGSTRSGCAPAAVRASLHHVRRRRRRGQRRARGRARRRARSSSAPRRTWSAT